MKCNQKQRSEFEGMVDAVVSGGELPESAVATEYYYMVNYPRPGQGMPEQEAAGKAARRRVLRRMLARATG